MSSPCLSIYTHTRARAHQRRGDSWRELWIAHEFIVGGLFIVLNFLIGIIINYCYYYRVANRHFKRYFRILYNILIINNVNLISLSFLPLNYRLRNNCSRRRRHSTFSCERHERAAVATCSNSPVAGVLRQRQQLPRSAAKAVTTDLPSLSSCPGNSA